MSKQKKILLIISFSLLLIFLFSSFVYASVTEEEVKQVMETQGKEHTTGNLLVWFLCAVSFLKISQKIDSILSSLGISVAHTGGSIMTETMNAMRGISSTRQFGGMESKNANYNNNSNPSDWLLSGGLSGTIGRMFTKGAMQSVTEKKDTITSSIAREAYEKSLSNSGKFSNNVIGSIAKGDISKDGSITGSSAVKAFQSYMGVNQAEDNKSLSNVDNSVDNVNNFLKTNNEVKESGINENTILSLNESDYKGENSNSILGTYENNSLYNSLVQGNVGSQATLGKENPDTNKFSENIGLLENTGISSEQTSILTNESITNSIKSANILTEQIQAVSNGYTNNPVESMGIPEEQVQTVIDNSIENMNIPTEQVQGISNGLIENPVGSTNIPTGQVQEISNRFIENPVGSTNIPAGQIQGISNGFIENPVGSTNVPTEQVEEISNGFIENSVGSTNIPTEQIQGISNEFIENSVGSTNVPTEQVQGISNGFIENSLGNTSIPAEQTQEVSNGFIENSLENTNIAAKQTQEVSNRFTETPIESTSIEAEQGTIVTDNSVINGSQIIKNNTKFSDIEIGGGKITGVETSANNPNGIKFAMYHTEQYMQPEDTYKVVKAIDGSKWYHQYAKNVVEREPYMKKDGKIVYDESIVKKLPPSPKRKDRI